MTSIAHRVRACALLSVSLALVAVSACECLPGAPLEHEISGSILIPLGSDADCAFDAGTELDADGNATTVDENGVVKYRYQLDAASGRCTIIVASWQGEMANVSDVQSEIDAQVEAAGLDPETAVLELEEVELVEVALSVQTADGAPFDLGRVGAYRATVNALIPGGDPSRIDGVLDVSHDGEGDPLEPTIVTSDDHAGLAVALQRAVEEEASLGADGDGQIDVDVNDLPELTNDGAGDAQLKVDYTLRIRGVVSVRL